MKHIISKTATSFAILALATSCVNQNEAAKETLETFLVENHEPQIFMRFGASAMIDGTDFYAVNYIRILPDDTIECVDRFSNHSPPFVSPDEMQKKYLFDNKWKIRQSRFARAHTFKGEGIYEWLSTQILARSTQTSTFSSQIDKDQISLVTDLDGQSNNVIHPEFFDIFQVDDGEEYYGQTHLPKTDYWARSTQDALWEYAKKKFPDELHISQCFNTEHDGE